MVVGLSGASGFIGRHVRRALEGRHEVVGFSRRPDRRLEGVSEVRLLKQGASPSLEGLDALVHLAGESVFGVWTRGRRQRIRESRIELTRALTEANARRSRPLQVLVCASGVGFYGDRGDDILSESAPAGDGFLAEVTREWEAAALEAARAGTRVVCLRLGMVLGPDGGAVPVLRKIFRAGAGGRLGSGRQWMSWIHVGDAAELVRHALEHGELEGPVNATAPGPVTNRHFTRVLAQLLHRPALLPAPGPALRLLLRQQARMLLDSQRTHPRKALLTGFTFRLPHIESAMADALGVPEPMPG